jgi:hypothetical protein
MRKLFFVSFVFLLAAAAVHGEDGKIPRALCFDPLCSSGCVCPVPPSYSSLVPDAWIDLHVRVRCIASLLVAILEHPQCD